MSEQHTAPSQPIGGFDHAEQGRSKTSPAVSNLSTGHEHPHREGENDYHDGMAIELCKVCGQRVRVMAYQRSGACCQRCLEVLEAQRDSQNVEILRGWTSDARLELTRRLVPNHG